MMSRMRLVFAVVCALALSVFAKASAPKYIFLFIGDGMSTPQRMIAEEYARKTGYGDLVINQLPYHATTRTASATSLVTDSAAAATAIACGIKTRNGSIGVDQIGAPAESTAEVAHRKGRAVGIITSVTMNHATPAGFYAHRASRAQLYGIGLDMVASGFDYFAGGGLSGHNDMKDDKEYRGNIFDLAKEAGYTLAGDEATFFTLKPARGQKVMALFGNDALGYVINGPAGKPSLAALVAKGIELLEDAPKGFFIMTEGGAIDWGGHSNDAATNLMELLELDKAVQVALDFAKKHSGETLIVVTGDHETGGMTMGFAGTGYAMYAERLANQKIEPGQFNKLIKSAKKDNANFSFDDAKPLLHQYFGFVFPDDEEDGKDDEESAKKEPMLLKKKQVKELREGFKKDNLGGAARKVINDIAGIGWTSGSHTALPVLTTAYGSEAETFHGFIENTDIAAKLKEMLERDKPKEVRWQH